MVRVYQKRVKKFPKWHPQNIRATLTLMPAILLTLHIVNANSWEVIESFTIHLKFYFEDMKKMDDKQVVKIEKQIITSQIAKEVELLKQYDPDKELKEEFEKASLYDLQKHLGEQS